MKKKSYILISKKNEKFRLIDQQKKDGKTSNTTIKDKRIDAINRLFLEDEISEVVARERLKKVRESIYTRRGENLPPGNTDNLAVLKKFWNSYRKKPKNRRMKDPDASYAKFRRAIEALEEVNITTATEEQIQEKLDKKYSGPNHNKIGTALRAILKFLERTDVELWVESAKSKKEIEFLTKDQVHELAEAVDDQNLKLFILAAFYTGMRTGELMYLPPKFVEKDIVLVKKQKKRDGSIDETKTKLERTAFIIPGGYKYVKAWAESNKKLPVKQNNLSHLIRRLSRKYVGESISTHGLRHSTAVYLVSQGAPIELVAQSLGNSAATCEAYYSGYQLTHLGINTLKKFVN